MDQSLINDPKREATSSIRGYVYQAYQSVFTWINLPNHEILYLEGAEDFDVFDNQLVTVTQVKDKAASGPVTLRSPDVVKAINDFWGHQKRNPEKIIRFRFLTTADIGQEQGSNFGEFKKGLEYWAMAGRDEQFSLKPLKDFLLTLGLVESLKEFLQSAEETIIRSQLIRNIDWDTGSRPKDALVAGIKDHLVLHGDRKGIDSSASEKVLDSLLRYIVELLSSKNERRLTYADFCRAFDSATMEAMPREEAVRLRSLANQIHTLPQSQISPSFLPLTQASNILDEPPPLVHGAALRERLVSHLAGILGRRGAIFLHGSTGLGKTSLARLLTDKIGEKWGWSEFRGRDPIQISDLLHRAAFEIKKIGHSLKIVLDDLDLGSIAQFEKDFIVLVFHVINNGGNVVITGPSRCPPDLLEKLWLPEECDQDVPYLNEQEIAAIILNHDFTDIPKLGQWNNVILLTTQGHPQLVHARVRKLQDKGWPPVEDMTWLQTSDLEEQRTLYRQRLIDEIPSEEARSLAYRLSLLTDRFPRQRALDLAQIPPPLPLPGESFDCIVGPWIEKVGEDKYRVSPLLQNEGNRVLSAANIREVHKTIALTILKNKTVSPAEVGTALLHAFVAKSEFALIKLSRGIILSGLNAWQAIGDVVFWFPMMALEPGQRLYEANLFVDFFLRLGQFRVASASRRWKEALSIMDRTFEVLEQADFKEIANSNTFLAYSMFLNSIEIPIPPRRLIDMLSRLMDIGMDDKIISEIVYDVEKENKLGMPLERLSVVQKFFSFEASRIGGLDELDELLDALDHLSSEKQNQLIFVFKDKDIPFTDLLIGTAWWCDSKREIFDINKAITILRRAIERGRVWQIQELICSAYVAISVIYDEYGELSQKALKVLDEAETELGPANTKILNQRAKVFLHLKEDHKSLLFYERALASNELPKVEKTFAYRSAGIAAARSGDWANAERLFLLGASGIASTDVLYVMSVGLKADAAFACWKQDRVTDALKLYTEVLKNLESIPVDQNLKNRYLHLLIRHSLAWIDAEASWGPRENHLEDPLPGACSDQEPHEALKDFQVLELPMIWGLLGNIDTKLGTGLGLAQLAVEKAGDKIPLVIRLGQRFSKFEALWRTGDIRAAVPVIVELLEGINYQKQVETKDFDGRHAWEIPDLPVDYWNNLNNRTYFLFSLLSIGVLSSVRNSQVPLPLDCWREDLKAIGVWGVEFERFLNLLSGKEMTSDGSLLEDATIALYRIRDTAISPQDLFACHFRLLNALLAVDWGYFAGKEFAGLLSKQWIEVTENQKFALLSPSLYVPTLLSKCHDSSINGYAKAAAILETAAVATGVRIARSGMEFLYHIRSTNIQDIYKKAGIPV